MARGLNACQLARKGFEAFAEKVPPLTIGGLVGDEVTLLKPIYLFGIGNKPLISICEDGPACRCNRAAIKDKSRYKADHCDCETPTTHGKSASGAPIVPQRVPMISPSTAVNPIVLAILRPW